MKLNVGGGGVEGAGETGGVEGVNGPCGGILYLSLSGMETDGVGGGVVVPVAGSEPNVGGGGVEGAGETGGVEGAGETGGVEGVNGPCGGILYLSLSGMETDGVGGGVVVPVAGSAN